MTDSLGPFKDWDKPAWEELFMGIAYMMAMMSPDPATKHGAVIVDKRNHVVSCGFNGFPPGCDDSKLPLTRPEKYAFMEHAESNAFNQKAVDVSGMTLYVTGHPCVDCFRRALCNRIKTIIYDPSMKSACVTEEHATLVRQMNEKEIIVNHHGARSISRTCWLKPFKGDPENCMQRAMEYRKVKMEQQNA